MKLSEWAKEQGIAYLTAWRWWKNGKLPVEAYQSPSGMVIIGNPKPSTPKKIEKEKIAVIYARVSSHDKKDDLERQANRLCEFTSSRGLVIDRVIKEIGSGMNDKRPKLMSILENPPPFLVVEHKDRLTRFGFNYIETLMKNAECELLVVNRDKEYEEDLTKDLIAVVTSFCSRLYGSRRGFNKKQQIMSVIKSER